MGSIEKSHEGELPPSWIFVCGAQLISWVVYKFYKLIRIWEYKDFQSKKWMLFQCVLEQMTGTVVAGLLNRNDLNNAEELLKTFMTFLYSLQNQICVSFVNYKCEFSRVSVSKVSCSNF